MHLTTVIMTYVRVQLPMHLSTFSACMRTLKQDIHAYTCLEKSWCMRIHAHKKHTHTNAHKHTHTHSHTHTNTNTHTHTHKHTLTQTHTLIHDTPHKNTHTHSLTHTYSHTHTHTHTHTHSHCTHVCFSFSLLLFHHRRVLLCLNFPLKCSCECAHVCV